MRIWLTGFAVLGMLLSTLPCNAQEIPEMPQPTERHQWLQQFVGEWDAKTDIFMEGQEPMQSKGALSVRGLGGFWMVAEHRGEMGGEKYTGIQTLGYDTEKNHYIGTWVDSFTGHLWTYTGELDEAKKVLTLRASGPCPMAEGQTLDFKEQLEVKSKDEYTFTSWVKNDQGEWDLTMRATYRRKDQQTP